MTNFVGSKLLKLAMIYCTAMENDHQSKFSLIVPLYQTAQLFLTLNSDMTLEMCVFALALCE